LQNTACTNFATEKVIVLASPGKVINEEVGIRTIQGQIRKGGCLTVQRSDWARHGHRTEKDMRGAAYHSAIRWEHVEQECLSTSKETIQWKAKTEERKKRLGMFGYKLPCYAAA